MSKRLHCSSDNSSGLFFFFFFQKKRKGKEKEAAYAAFIYLLTCPLLSPWFWKHGQCLLVLVSDFYYHQLSQGCIPSGGKLLGGREEEQMIKPSCHAGRRLCV